MFSKVTVHETGVEVDKLPKEKLEFLDVNGLKRDHLTIYWKCSEDDIADIVRDLLKCQYMINYKWLHPVSYQYIAQKSTTNADTNNIASANITIEPLCNDFETLISRIPINQKLELGTNVTLEKSISYEKDDEGKIQERKYLRSNNLVFDTKQKLDRPFCLGNYHIGAQEVGSTIRAKYMVQYADKTIGKFRLFNFRRSPTDKLFVIQLWHYYGLSMEELLNMILDYVTKEYEDPTVYTLNHNDRGSNLLKPEKLAVFLKELIEAVKKTKIEKVSMQDLLKIWVDAEK